MLCSKKTLFLNSSIKRNKDGFISTLCQKQLITNCSVKSFAFFTHLFSTQQNVDALTVALNDRSLNKTAVTPNSNLRNYHSIYKDVEKEFYFWTIFFSHILFQVLSCDQRSNIAVIFDNQYTKESPSIEIKCFILLLKLYSIKHIQRTK